MALAGFEVHIVTTCSSVKPSPRKRVIISVMLCTVLSRPGTVRSVLMQCGKQPLVDAAAAHVEAEIRPSVGGVEPDAPRRCLTRLGHQVPIGVQDAPGIGGEVVGENVALLEERQQASG